MMKSKIPKKTYAVSYKKNAVPLSISKVNELISKNCLSGFIEQEGTLDNGDTFCRVYLIIKQSFTPNTDENGK